MKRKYFVIILLFNTLVAVSQTINVSSPISSSRVIADLKTYNLQGKTILVSGTAEFANSKGFARILLTDDYGYDLLIYESIPLITSNNIDIFSNKTTETINIPTNLRNCKVRVEIYNTLLRNLVINIVPNNYANIQRVTNKDRIAQINAVLHDKKALWVAGETSISKMSYEEKKALFGGKIPDLEGAEYYVGGIFELNDKKYPPPVPSKFVDNFDWRNRHGKNWLTSVKDQGSCGSCWAFGALGAVEGLVNLYYNRLINLDLSEEQMKACTNGSCNGGFPGGLVALEYIKQVGAVSESCLPYTTTDNHNCRDVCNNPDEQIKISDHRVFYSMSLIDSTYNPIDELKKFIIKNGILSGRIAEWHHTIALVGYGTIKAGDKVKLGSGDFITIPVNDPRIGQIYWIFKNSWGSDWGDNGYCFVITDMFQLEGSVIPISPIISKNYKESDIVCEDKDGDGYYWWGIGEKPETCPNCPKEPDGDDSNPELGPMDEYGNCKKLGANLIVRDNDEDTGLEPNPTFKAWRSPDIWLADYSFNPIFWIYSLKEYKDKSCYIAVKIKNISKNTSDGNEKLHIHWSNSSLRSYWNISWVKNNGAPNTFNFAEGAEITPQEGINIPVLKPNEEITLYVLWNLPPKYLDSISLFPGQNKPPIQIENPNWGFALMARIDDGNAIKGLLDVLFSTSKFAKNSNNIAISNGTLFLIDKKYHQLSELKYINKPFIIKLNQLSTNGKYKLGNFADIYVVLSNDLMKNLNKETSKGIKIIDKTTVLLQSANVELYFNALDKKDGNYFIGAEVYFISDKIPEYNEFNFDMILKVQDEPEETLNFTAIRNENIFFKADAQADKKKIVKAREEVTLQSNIIDDNASYVWFDQNGNQIGEGSKITVMPQISQKYKVVITKEEDGYRSYDEVEVIAVDGIIKSLSPNPAHNELKVVYELSDNINTISANIQISNIQQTVVIDYPIDSTSKDKTISISGYNTGAYIVKLLINGKVVDTQNLIIY